MKNISEDVKVAIQKFVEQKQSFISLDIYCLLGVRIDNEDYPIHQQVRDAYIQGLMPNYLSSWTRLTLESGGYAEVWKYYLPVVEVKTVVLNQRSDGRLELTKEALGHFPLLDASIGIFISDHDIIIGFANGSEDYLVKDLESRIRLPQSALIKANLDKCKYLTANIYQNKIVISGGN